MGPAMNEKGQSSIEFAMTLFLVIIFFVFFFQLAITFAIGNYFHYATFMSARAYLSAGSDEGDQQARARNTLSRMVKKSIDNPGADRWPFFAKGRDGDGQEIGPGAQFQPKSTDYSWMQGVRYRFRSRLLMFPGLGGDGPASLDLTSESWLGREPTYSECMKFLEERVGKVVIDNGC